MHLKHTLQLPLFDVRIRAPHKDVIVLKGNENEVQLVPFEGNVKFLISEDIHVKKVSLQLVGEFNYEYFEKTADGHGSLHSIDRLCILDVEWNNLLTSPMGKVVFGNYGDKYCKYQRLELYRRNLGTSTPREGASPPFSRTMSSSTIDSALLSKILKIPKTGNGVDGTPFENSVSGNHSFLLPKGNYNLPFSAFLPTDLAQTVEGLGGGSVLYRVMCNIERGRFEKAFHSSKVVRIFRTLHPRNMNMVASMDIENIWPGKVQYSVNLPRKGVAIGLTISINFLIVPIAKGLSVKGITGCIVQHYNMVHDEGESPVWEQIISKQDLVVPALDILAETWAFKTHFKVEDHLKLISPSCNLKNDMIVVKHRLRISVQLENLGGHISELRANLPIHVYISPNTGHVVGRHYSIEPTYGTFVLDRSKDDAIFKRHDVPREDDVSEDEEDESDDAPPLYQKHVYDKVYDINSPRSPLQQLLQLLPVSSANNSSTNLTAFSYFDLPRADHQQSIDESLDNNTSKVLLRAALALSIIGTPNLDVSKLCEVPSYQDALDDEDEPELVEPAPNYVDLNAAVAAVTASKPPLRRGQSSNALLNRFTLNRSSTHLGLHRHSASRNPLTRSLSFEGVGEADKS